MNSNKGGLEEKKEESDEMLKLDGMDRKMRVKGVQYAKGEIFEET